MYEPQNIPQLIGSISHQNKHEPWNNMSEIKLNPMDSMRFPGGFPDDPSNFHALDFKQQVSIRSEDGRDEIIRKNIE